MESAPAAPTASAMTDIGIDNEKRSRMMASLHLVFFVYSFLYGDLRSPIVKLPCRTSLLERILFHTDEISGVVLGGRVRAAALSIGELFHAGAKHQLRVTIIAFNAAGLVVDAILLLVLPGVFELGGPGPRPDGRIVNGDDILKRVRSGARPALDEM